ncbi:hypothetical protein [Cerasibacillus terrae]|nr:hypothetical protein [Cerasibacillus terrae]
MKRFGVIGFDIRGYYLTGKVFKDKNATNEYFRFLNDKDRFSL